MGDPKKPKNLYSRPIKLWDSVRMLEETSLVEEYGIRRKKELWKASGLVSNFTQKAKSLIKNFDAKSESEKIALINKLQSLKILGPGAKLDDVLAIKMKDFLERRLQTIVFRKGLAKTMLQSRQFIVHKHIKVGNNVVTAPSYLVKAKDEELIIFSDLSKLKNAEHPERLVVKSTKAVSSEANVSENKTEKRETKPHFNKKLQNRFDNKKFEKKK